MASPIGTTDTYYLDHAATTPTRPESVQAMVPYHADDFGNPSSTHGRGRAARAALERARERIAGALGARPREIVFTGGGTEADNLAVLGRWRAAVHETEGAPTIVASAIEHSAVLGALDAAAAEGARTVVLGVDEDGRVDPGELDEALAGDSPAARPAVVSVMWGNNEVGTIQPIARLAESCRETGIPFHTDAVQAFAKLDVRVDRAPCDLVSISAHKIGGPKGIGVLYVRNGVDIQPLIHGGGQERDLRPGTQNVAAAVGFAAAVEAAMDDREAEAARLAQLRDRLESALTERIAGAAVNAAGAERLPNITNISVPDADRDALLMALDLEGVAASSGSACHSGAAASSHVLVAMGRSRDDAVPVRLSLGWSTTESEIEAAIERTSRVIERVRKLSGHAATA